MSWEVRAGWAPPAPRWLHATRTTQLRGPVVPSCSEPQRVRPRVLLLHPPCARHGDADSGQGHTSECDLKETYDPTSETESRVIGKITEGAEKEARG